MPVLEWHLIPVSQAYIPLCGNACSYAAPTELIIGLEEYPEIPCCSQLRLTLPSTSIKNVGPDRTSYQTQGTSMKEQTSIRLRTSSSAIQLAQQSTRTPRLFNRLCAQFRILRLALYWISREPACLWLSTTLYNSFNAVAYH